MKKKIPLMIFLILFMSFSSFTGCEEKDKADAGKIKIVTTIFPQYDFARAITVGKADITMLLHPASESHSYEPTPKDITAIQNCDIFIYVGGESDEWVKGILASLDTSKMKIITLMDCVEVVEEELLHGMEAEEEEAEHHGKGYEREYDEHVWTSPRNAKLIVQRISEVICELDKENAADYAKNTADYIQKLDKLDERFKEITGNAARKTLVFGDRFPFRYFADTYGLECFAAFPGCSAETEASMKTVAFLVDKVKSEGIPVILYIELSSPKMAKTIAAETGAKTALFHSCHNITKKDFNDGKTYLELMQANAATLEDALN